MSIRVLFTQKWIFINFFTLHHYFLHMFYIFLLREENFGLFVFLQKFKSLCSTMQGADINIYIWQIINLYYHL